MMPMNRKSDLIRSRRDQASTALRAAVAPLSVVFLLASVARADDPSDATIVLEHCQIDYERMSLLGFPSPGIMQECAVKLGDRVKAGQVLARVHDQEARAELELRTAEAGSDALIRLREVEHAQALTRFKTTDQLMKRKVSSAEDYALARLEVDEMRMKLEEAKDIRRMAVLRARLAEAALNARRIVAPHDGVVVDVMKRPGEVVTPAEPVFKLVDVDKVRILAKVDVVNVTNVSVNQEASVSVEVGGADLAVERRSFKAKVLFVDPLVDTEDQTNRVVLALDNSEGVFRSGLRARVEIAPPADGPIKLGRSQRTSSPLAGNGRGAR